VENWPEMKSSMTNSWPAGKISSHTISELLVQFAQMMNICFREEDISKDLDASSECQKQAAAPTVKVLIAEKAVTLTDPIKIKAPDRTVESPPCEVSSTTAAEIEKPSASNVSLADDKDKTKADENWIATESKSDVESVSDSQDEQDEASKYNGDFSPPEKDLETPEAKDDDDTPLSDDESISKEGYKYNSDGDGSQPEANDSSPGKLSAVEEIDDDDDLGEMDSVKPGE
jgi:hypothetical protein